MYEQLNKQRRCLPQSEAVAVLEHLRRYVPCISGDTAHLITMRGLAIVTPLFVMVALVGTSAATTVEPASGPTTSLVLGTSSRYEPASTATPPDQPKPVVYSLHVESRIESRYARNVISSRLANPANSSQEVLFSVVLPETAFISGFLMEIDSKVYRAYVKEKEEAKKEYEQAVSSGQSAAHVAVSARDSNRFTVSVNVEPQTKITFNLTYEELLTRRLSEYNHVINLNPGQIVQDLRVDVYIKESRNITVLRVPQLRSGNEIDPEEAKKVNALAVVERTSATEAHITFSPTPEEQEVLGQNVNKGSPKPEGAAGFGGQFVVQYDVDRDPQAGEVLVNNGYFVHFFAPTELPPLKKHAIFVLDVSGSMEGRKIEQLKEAMISILDDLNEGDFFNIVEFSYSVTVWNLDSTAASAVFSPTNSYYYDDVPKPHPGPTPAFPATPEYIKKAKDIIKKMTAGGGTNIHDTLKTAIKVAHEGLVNMSSDTRPQPIIVFLTDGEPTVGEVRPTKIFSTVNEFNEQPKAAIFSLAFGDDADFNFLKKLSLRNSGFARKIYEAADASLQLRDFYRQVASPLLVNVTFDYRPEQVDEGSVTKNVFHTLFSGSELVVAGKVKDSTTLQGEVSGQSIDGDSLFPILWPSLPVRREPSSLERLWAYLTIRQLLEEREATTPDESRFYFDDVTTEKPGEDNATETAKKRALDLALQYSFVTSLTSLVVVKPNTTSATEPDHVQPAAGGSHYAQPLFSALPGPAALFSPADRIDSSAQFQDDAPESLRPPPPRRPLPAYTTTFSPPSTKEALFLVTLEELTWLQNVTDESGTLLLPVGVNGTNEVFRLGVNETESGLVTCATSTGATGVCRHLSRCVLNSFKQDIQVYLGYFCSIGSYAGVCCPDEIYPTTERATTTETPVQSTTTTEMPVQSTTTTETPVQSTTRAVTAEDSS